MSIKLLFICLGNICRSPAAEEVMRQIISDDKELAGRFTTASAAIGPWHVGDLPDLRMRRHGAARGYDFHSRARQFSSDDFDRYDLILGMDEDNIFDIERKARNDSDLKKIRCLADFMTQHPQYHTIPDPYYGGAKDFELALDLIEDACHGLADYLKNTMKKKG